MEKLLYKLHRYFKVDYHLAVLDMDAGKRWVVKPEASNIAYLKAENAQGKHILIQPAVQGCYLMAETILQLSCCIFTTSLTMAVGNLVEWLLRHLQATIRYGYMQAEH